MSCGLEKFKLKIGRKKKRNYNAHTMYFFVQRGINVKSSNNMVPLKHTMIYTNNGCRSAAPVKTKIGNNVKKVSGYEF